MQRPRRSNQASDHQLLGFPIANPRVGAEPALSLSKGALTCPAGEAGRLLAYATIYPAQGSVPRNRPPLFPFRFKHTNDPPCPPAICRESPSPIPLPAGLVV